MHICWTKVLCWNRLASSYNDFYNMADNTKTYCESLLSIFLVWDGSHWHKRPLSDSQPFFYFESPNPRLFEYLNVGFTKLIFFDSVLLPWIMLLTKSFQFDSEKCFWAITLFAVVSKETFNELICFRPMFSSQEKIDLKINWQIWILRDGQVCF